MEQDIKLIEDSFRKVIGCGNDFVASFYGRLFNMFPDVKPLFKNVNMARQREKLLASLVTIVNNLRKPDILEPYLKELGRHHIEYRIKPEHFPMVGAALLATFEEFLGDDWTPELNNAWGKAYNETSETMLKAYK